MKVIFFCGVLFFGWMCTQAQSSRDSVLLNERTMDRPITLHGGQMRITGGYTLGINTLQYDASGAAIDLSSSGFSYLSNSLSGEIKYGVNDFIQVTASIAQSSQAVRSQTTYVIASPTLEINSMNISDGWKDVFLALDFRAPFRTRKMDWLVSAGAFVPTAASRPDVPTHSIAPSTINNTVVSTAVSYQYYKALGYGVPALQLGTLFKYRFANSAISVGASYLKPTGEVMTSYWLSQYTGGSFEYREVPYNYKSPDELGFGGEFEYQLYPWFDLLANVSYKATSNGYSYESGAKVDTPSTYLVTTAPGFEIIITHKIWLRQRVSIPLAGQNQVAPALFITTLSYNMFPFAK